MNLTPGTVSALGAPAAPEKFVKPMDYVRTVETITDFLGIPVYGLITNEMGGLSSVNGLTHSAVLGIPVMDASCNGRAYPMAAMGAMSLEACSTSLVAGKRNSIVFRFRAFTNREGVPVHPLFHSIVGDRAYFPALRAAWAAARRATGSRKGEHDT